MKILIIDDHRCFRESLVLALKNECPDFEFLETGSADAAKKMLLQNNDCDCLFLDLQVGKENGLCILSELRKIRREIKTLICTAFYEPLTIENAIKMNVQGFITKTSCLKEIAEALKTVADGEKYFCPEALAVMEVNVLRVANAIDSATDGKMQLFARYKTLSLKEKEVFDLLSQKLDVAQIAKRLKKSVKTVENQRSAVYSKMHIHDRLEAVEAGKMLGII